MRGERERTVGWLGARGIVVRLDHEDIEAIATRLAELLRHDHRSIANSQTSRGLVDAATLARLLGISRATVYAKAEELGAIRVGTGKRARLRFDPTRLVADRQATCDGSLDRSITRGRRARKSTQSPNVDLLPIRGGRTRSAGPLRS